MHAPCKNDIQIESDHLNLIHELRAKRACEDFES